MRCRSKTTARMRAKSGEGSRLRNEDCRKCARDGSGLTQETGIIPRWFTITLLRGSVRDRRDSSKATWDIYRLTLTALTVTSSSNPDGDMLEVGLPGALSRAPDKAHARRHFYEALDKDRTRMEFYGIEKIARERTLRGEARRILREQGPRPVPEHLHSYPSRIRAGVASKSAAGQGGGLCAQSLGGAGTLLRRPGSGYR